jgi:hypothetical protein
MSWGALGFDSAGGFRVHSFFLRRESGLDDLPAGLLCCVEASKTYDQATSPLLYLRL